MVLILGFNIVDVFDVLAVIYKDFTVYLLEFKLNLISILYDKFNIKSVEKVIKDVETQIQKSKVNRLQDDSKNKPFRPDYVTDPRPDNSKFNLIDTIRKFNLTDAIVNSLISSKDIILNNLFYFIVLSFLALFGIHYHNEVSTTSSTILDWWKLFNRKPGNNGGNHPPFGRGWDDDAPINLGDARTGDVDNTSPVLNSNKVTESWNTSNPSSPDSSSPTSTGSNTPTGSSTGSNTPTAPVDPRREEYNSFFRDPDDFT
jgi:hypothetical protein